MSIGQKAQFEAYRLLNKYGTTVTLSSVTTTVNDTTGAVAKTSTKKTIKTIVQAVGAATNITASDLAEGSLTETKSMAFTIAALAATPKVGDTITLGTDVYTLTTVNTEYAMDYPVLYTAQGQR